MAGIGTMLEYALCNDCKGMVGGIGGYSEPGIGDRNCGVTSTEGDGRVRRGKGNGSCAGLAPHPMPPLLVG